jgi:hypothetical protein
MVNDFTHRPTMGLPVDITGRTAYCEYSHEDLTEEQARLSLSPSPAPSSTHLPYFEFRGPYSIWSQTFCDTCGQGKSLHFNPDRANETCGVFVEREPAEFDSFYCGCRGRVR